MNTDPKPNPANLREVQATMCEIIARLYELQLEFDRVAAPEITTEFDNAIVDCVNACTTVVAEHIRSTVFDS